MNLFFLILINCLNIIQLECYGNITKKIGICTTKNICHFGLYQPFLNVDEHISIKGFECQLGEICCTKGKVN